jgi:hypothetical protein
MQSFPRLESIAPRNISGEDLNIFMAEKHRELSGFLCPWDKSA